MATPHWGASAYVTCARLALGMVLVGLPWAAFSQLAIHQHITGRNEQVLVLDHATLLNIARNGAAAEMNLASTLGPGEVQGNKRTVYVRGSIVNIADGPQHTASVNIGTNEARTR